MSHSNIVCRKCGATGHSKCPYCRTIFGDNQSEDILSWIFKRRIEKVPSKADVDENLHWLRVDLYLGSNKDGCTTEYGLTKLREILNAMEDPNDPYPTIKQYSCDHEWVFAPGQKSTIDCGHGSKK